MTETIWHLTLDIEIARRDGRNEARRTWRQLRTCAVSAWSQALGERLNYRDAQRRGWYAA